jgi:hypothetical protein
VGRGYVKQIEAAGKMLRAVELREVTGLCEHLIEIERHVHQPLALEIIVHLSQYRSALVSRQQITSDKQFEGVWNFELVNRRERDLTGTTNRVSRCG